MPAPKPAFRNNDLSPGSAIEHAARAAAENRGHYGGAGQAGDFGSPGRSGAKALDQAEILTDTMGVDFGPYLTQVVKIVKPNWYNLMPPSVYSPVFKQGKVSIEFVILKDGKVTGMAIRNPSGDVALDRAAWMSITASDPFPPLPKEFPGKLLGLRFHFFYNPDKSDLDASPTSQPSKSGTTVSISPRRVQLVANSQQTFSATVTGTANRAVTWSVIGLDCSGSGDDCGTVSPSGLYTAPHQVHSPVFVKVKAVSKAASAACDLVTVRVSPGGSATVSP